MDLRDFIHSIKDVKTLRVELNTGYVVRFRPDSRPFIAGGSCRNLLWHARKFDMRAEILESDPTPRESALRAMALGGQAY